MSEQQFKDSTRFRYRGHVEVWRRKVRDFPNGEFHIYKRDYVPEETVLPLGEFDDPLDFLRFTQSVRAAAGESELQPGDMILTYEYDVPGEPAWVWRGHSYLLLTESQWEVFEGRSTSRLLRGDADIWLHGLECTFPSSKRNTL